METIKLDVKPLSVNEVWKGRRFKTDAYKRYEKTLLTLLPNSLKVAECRLKIVYHYGFSNSNSDIDNPCKPITDILQKKYGFNDRQIYEMHIFKEVVKKGDEYIKIKIECLDS